MASRVPDAWDDDYPAAADSKPSDPTPAQVQKASRAERKAQHAAAQKALWDSAENPETTLPFFLQARSSDPPLKTNHKGQVQVLTRKPKEAPKGPILARRPASGVTSATGLENGVNGMSIAQKQEEEELDSEDEARLEQERTLKERQEKARVDREEKAKKYEEARRRIFGDSGSPDKSAGGAASPNSRQRGGARGGRGGSRNNSRPTSAAQSPARLQQSQQAQQVQQQSQRQLFDADYTPKPGSNAGQGRSVQSYADNGVIRQPRGPDGSGRGGFGFAQRGGNANMT